MPGAGLSTQLTKHVVTRCAVAASLSLSLSVCLSLSLLAHAVRRGPPFHPPPPPPPRVRPRAAMLSFAPQPHIRAIPSFDVVASGAPVAHAHPSRVVAAVREQPAGAKSRNDAPSVMRSSFGRVFPWAAAGDALRRSETIARGGGLSSGWPVAHFKRPPTKSAPQRANSAIASAATWAGELNSSQRPSAPHRVVRPKKFRVVRSVKGCPAPPRGWRPEFKEEQLAASGRGGGGSTSFHSSRARVNPQMVTLVATPQTSLEAHHVTHGRPRPRSAGEVEGRSTSRRVGGRGGAQWSRGGNEVVLTGRALRGGGVTVDFDPRRDELRMSFGARDRRRAGKARARGGTRRDGAAPDDARYDDARYNMGGRYDGGRRVEEKEKPIEDSDQEDSDQEYVSDTDDEELVALEA